MQQLVDVVTEMKKLCEKENPTYRDAEQLFELATTTHAYALSLFSENCLTDDIEKIDTALRSITWVVALLYRLHFCNKFVSCTIFQRITHNRLMAWTKLPALRQFALHVSLRVGSDIKKINNLPVGIYYANCEI